MASSRMLRSYAQHFDLGTTDKAEYLSFLEALGLGVAPVFLIDGTSINLADYLVRDPCERPNAVGLLEQFRVPCHVVPAALAFVRVRSAVDAFPASTSALDAACDELERVFFNKEAVDNCSSEGRDTLSRVPVSLRPKRRRPSGQSSRYPCYSAACLESLASLGIRTRICLLALKILRKAVDVRSYVGVVCADALRVSTRLLALARCLPLDSTEVSVTALLATAADLVGFISIQNLDVDPEPWVLSGSSILDQLASVGDRGHEHIVTHMLGGMMSTIYGCEDQNDVSATCASTVMSAVLDVLDSVDALFVRRSGEEWLLRDSRVLGDLDLAKAYAYHQVAEVSRFMGELTPGEFDEPHSWEVTGPLSVFRILDFYAQRRGSKSTLLDFVLELMQSSATRLSEAERLESESGLRRSRSSPQPSPTSNDSFGGHGDVHFTIPDVFDLRSPACPSSSAPSPPPILDDIPSQKLQMLNRNRRPSPVEIHREVVTLGYGVFSAILRITVGDSTCIERRQPYSPTNLKEAIVKGCAVASKLTTAECLAQEGSLYRGVIEFSVAAGAWLGCPENLGVDWSQLASQFSDLRCPVEMLGYVFKLAPADVVGEVVVGGLVRILNDRDRTMNEGSKAFCVPSGRDLASAVLHAGSLVCKEAAPSLLISYLHKIHMLDLDSPTTDWEWRCSVVAMLFARFLFQKATDSADFALEVLSISLENIEDDRDDLGKVIVVASEQEYSSSFLELGDSQRLRYLTACHDVLRIIPAHVQQLTRSAWLAHLKDIPVIFGCETLSLDIQNPHEAERRGRRRTPGLFFLVWTAYTLVYHAREFVASPSEEDAQISSLDGRAPAAHSPPLRVGDIGQYPSRSSGLFELADSLRRRPAAQEALSLLRAICKILQDVLRSIVHCPLGEIIYLDGVMRHYVHYFGSQSLSLTPTELSKVFQSIVYCVEANPSCRGSMSGLERESYERRIESSKDFGWNIMRRNALYLRAGVDGDASEIVSLLLDTVGTFVDSTSDTFCLTDNATILEAGYASAAVVGMDSAIDVKLQNWINRAASVSIPMAGESDAMSASSVIALGCKISRIIKNATRSRSEMDAFVSSVKKYVTDESALAFELLLVQNSQGTNVTAASYREWAANVLPVVTLDEIVEKLMIPVDDSAVSVDAAAQALGSLSNACRRNRALAIAVATSLERLSDGLGGDHFFLRVCRRAVMETVTMSPIAREFIVALTTNLRVPPSQTFVKALYSGCMAIIADLRSVVLTIAIEELRRVIEFLGSLFSICGRNAKHLVEVGRSIEEQHPYACFVHGLLDALVALYGVTGRVLNCDDAQQKSVLIVGTLHSLRRCVDRCAKKENVLDTSASLDQLSDACVEPDITEMDVDSSVLLHRAAQQSSKLCTYTSTGSQFVEQHWYFCYTCGLSGQEGVCATCADVCHAGHDLSYSKYSRFFCDCGATSGRPTRTAAPETEIAGRGTAQREHARRRADVRGALTSTNSNEGTESDSSPGSRLCLCLKPRAPGLAVNDATSGTLTVPQVSDEDEKVWTSVASMVRGPDACSISCEEETDGLTSAPDGNTDFGLAVEEASIIALRATLQSERVASKLTTVARALLGFGGINSLSVEHESFGPVNFEPNLAVLAFYGKDSDSLFRSRRICKTLASHGFIGSPTTKLSEMQKKSLMSSGSAITFINRSSLLVFATEDMVSVMSLHNLLPGHERLRDAQENDEPGPVSLLARFETPFAVRSIRSNLERPEFLLICGAEAVIVYVLDIVRLRVISKISLSLGLQDVEAQSFQTDIAGVRPEANKLLRVDWIPGSCNLVLVITEKFVKIFDLNDDPVCPAYFASISSSFSASGSVGAPHYGDIVDAAVMGYSSDGFSCYPDEERFRGYLFVSSSGGMVLRGHLTENERGPCVLEEFMDLSSTQGETRFLPPIAMALSIRPDRLWILVENGSVYVAELMQPSLRGNPGFKNVYVVRFERNLPSGRRFSLSQVPGKSTSMLVSSSGSEAMFTGILDLPDVGQMSYQALSETSQSVVIGTAALARPIGNGGPGIVVMMEDGSVVLLETNTLGSPCPHLSESGSPYIDHRAVADIAKEVRAESIIQLSGKLDACSANVKQIFNPSPSTVGFFENCRVISDEVSFSGALGSKGEQTMRVPLAAASREAFVGAKPGSPIQLSIRCRNKSIVIVGLRIQIGATDRSRAQIPGRVQVFERTVKWSADRTNSTRWIDVPLTIPESVRSPHEVLIELEPKSRHRDEGQAVFDTVSFDALEVYGVRLNEFAERRRIFESDAASYAAALKKSIDRRRRTRLAETVMPKERDDSISLCNQPIYSRYDVRHATVLACIKIALGCSSVQSDSAIALRAEIDVTDSVLCGTALRRYTPRLQRAHALSVRPMYEFLAQLGDIYVLKSQSVETIDRDTAYLIFRERAIHATTVVQEHFTTPFKAGHPVGVSTLERIIFLAARISRFALQWVFLFGQDFVQDDSDAGLCRISSLITERASLRALFSAYARCRQMDRLLASAGRDMCSNMVDLLLISAWCSTLSSLLKCSDAPDHVENAGDIEFAVTSLVALMTSSDEDIRLFSCRRIIDMFDPYGINGSSCSSDPVSVVLSLAGPSVDAEKSTSHAEVASGVTRGEEADRWTYKCDVCQTVCEPTWWHCANCADFDLCCDCVNLRGDALPQPHDEKHLLLRGVPDSQESLPYPAMSLSRFDMTCRTLFREIISNLMLNVFSAEESRLGGIRVLESINMIHRLISAPSDLASRAGRLKELFHPASGFVKGLEAALSLSDAKDWGAQGLVPSVFSGVSRAPGSKRYKRMEVSYLLLRLLASVMDVGIAPYILDCGLLQTFARFLDKLAPVLTADAAEATECITSKKSSFLRDMPSRGRNLVLPAAVLSGQIPSPLLDHGSIEEPREPLFAIFGLGRHGILTSPALEITLPILNIYIHVLGSVAGHFLDVNIGSVSKATLSALSHLSQNDFETGTDPHSDVVTDGGPSTPSLYSMVASRARRLLLLVCRGHAMEFNMNLDFYAFEQKLKSLFTIQADVGVIGDDMSYDIQLEVANTLMVMLRLARQRPEHWRSYTRQRDAHLCDDPKDQDPSLLEGVSSCSVSLLLWQIAMRLSSGSRVKSLQLIALSIENVAADMLDEFEAPQTSPDTGSVGRCKAVEIENESSCPAEVKGAPAEGDAAVVEILPCPTVAFLTSSSLQPLREIVGRTLLRSSEASVRHAISVILKSLVVFGSRTRDITLLSSVGGLLTDMAPSLSVVGHRGVEFTDVIVSTLTAVKQLEFEGEEFSWVRRLGMIAGGVLRKSAKRISVHPNAYIYKALATFISIDGFYLESEPCLTCCTELTDENQRDYHRLDALRAESKFTDCAIFCRLSAAQSIARVMVKIGEPDSTRMVKRINFYHSVRSVADAAELKARDHPWRLSASLQIGEGQRDAQVGLDIPVEAANVMFEFASFHTAQADQQYNSGRNSAAVVSSNSPTLYTLDTNGIEQSPSGGLQCPRCSRQVTDRYGICRSCGVRFLVSRSPEVNRFATRIWDSDLRTDKCESLHFVHLQENSFQCRACRNIMYEVLDGFMCNECGYCKHGRFEFTLFCRPSYEAEPIMSEQDRRRATLLIERETDDIHKHHKELQALRGKLVQVMGGTPSECSHEFDTGIVHVQEQRAPVVPSSTEFASAVDLSNMDIFLRTLVGDDLRILPNVTQALSGLSVDPDLQAGREGGIGQSRVRRSSQRAPSKSNDGASASLSDVTADSPSPRRDTLLSYQASLAANLYDRDCRIAFAGMSRGIIILTSAREELTRYASSRFGDGKSDSYSKIAGPDHVLDFQDNEFATNCFGCNQSCTSHCLRILESVLGRGIAAQSSLDSDFAVMLIRCSNLFVSRKSQRAVRNIIKYLVTNNSKTTAAVCKEVRRKLEFCVQAFQSVDVGAVVFMELLVLQDISCIEDSCWEDRLRTIFQILLGAANASVESASVAEQVILPCLRAASGFLRMASIESGVATSAASVGSRSQASTDVFVDADGEVTGAESPMASERVAGRSSTDVRPIINEVVGPRDSAIADKEQDGNAASPLLSEVASDSVVDARVVEQRGRVDSDEFRITALSANRIMEESHETGAVAVDFNKWSQGRDNFLEWIGRTRIYDANSYMSVREAVGAHNSASSDSVLRGCLKHWRKAATASEAGPLKAASSSLREEKMGTWMGDVSWALKLLLYTPCGSVRGETSRLLDELCRSEELLSLRLLDSLLGRPLKDAASVGSMSAEFFDVIQRSIGPKEVRLYLVAKGFLLELALLIEAEAERILDTEQYIAARAAKLNLFHGYVLQRLVAVLKSVLSSISGSALQVRERCIASKRSNVIAPILRAFLSVARLISLRNKITDECLSSLREILSAPNYLFLAPSGEVVITACVKELGMSLETQNMPSISTILDLLCGILCPLKEEPVYQLILEKAATQEEFIRGNMTRAFYPSSEFDGPLMRDVKVKICQDLDLIPLLEEDCGDFGLELIVAGNLVKLDLPISAVYEQVWRGSVDARELAAGEFQRRRNVGVRRAVAAAVAASAAARASQAQSQPALSCPPMVVVYRLSGLDGEATEPIIDRLPDSSASSMDPEVEFRATKTLGDVSGLFVLLRLLSVVGSWSDNTGVAVREPALRLLRASCEVADNRSRLASTPGAVGILMDCAASALERSQDSLAAVESAESLLIATEKILSEHSRDGGPDPGAALADTRVDAGTDHKEDIVARLRAFLGHLSIVSSPKAEASLLHLLPYLMQGERTALEVAYEHFSINWERIDDDVGFQRAAAQLATVLLAAPLDFRGDKLYELMMDRSLALLTAEYLNHRFPSPKGEHADLWGRSLKAGGVPYCLNVLKGLAKGLRSPSAGTRVADHLRVVLSDAGMILTLCQLEMAVSANSIGSAAEEVLEELQQDCLLGSAITEERRRMRRARRAAAEASKRAALESTIGSLYRVRDSTEQLSPGLDNTHSQPSDLLVDVPDEVGPACVVCGDGFISRPDEALGAYVLSRRVPIGSVTEAGRPDDLLDESANSRSWSMRSGISFFIGSPPSAEVAGNGGRGRGSGTGTKFCFSNVTHFNAIHLACHREAARGDRSIRPPRDEWDGASLRNSQTKCNNIFPIKPPVCFAVDDRHGKTSDGNRSMADSSFDAVVEFYMGRLTSIGRTNMSQLQLVLHDISQSISRFACGKASLFSEISQGGGPHSNACLIPHMIQLALHIMEKSKSPSQASTSMKDDIDLFAVHGSRDMSFSLCLAKCLVGLSLVEWEEGSPKLLSRVLDGSQRALVTEDDLSARVLREFAFTDRTMRLLKESIGDPTEGWQWLLTRKIAQVPEWLLDVSSRLTNAWEHEIYCIVDGEQLVKCLRGGISDVHKSEVFIRKVRCCFEVEETAKV